MKMAKKASALLALLFSQAFAQMQSYDFNVKTPDQVEAAKELPIAEQPNNDIMSATDNESDVLFVKPVPPRINNWQMLVQNTHKNYDEIKQALENGNNINQSVTDSQNILHLAAMQNNYELAHFALMNHATLTALNKFNDTPVHWAAASKNPEILKEELSTVSAKDLSILLNKENKNKRNALHFNALYAGNLEITQMLIDNKCNMNAQDNKGQTPLQYAIAMNKWDVAALLLKNGALANIKDNEGDTAEDYLTQRGSVDGYIKLYPYVSEKTKHFIENRLSPLKFYADKLVAKSTT